MTALRMLAELERKVLWLATWMIHSANHLRDNGDGLKVGGHQASSASLATIMTALYFHALRPEDRVAVKPHAGPIFHAIQYLLGNQTRERLESFRALGGAQSYPSRTKDADDVDFSTGSVGLGVAMTAFAPRGHCTKAGERHRRRLCLAIEQGAYSKENHSALIIHSRRSRLRAHRGAAYLIQSESCKI